MVGTVARTISTGRRALSIVAASTSALATGRTLTPRIDAPRGSPASEAGLSGEHLRARASRRSWPAIAADRPKPMNWLSEKNASFDARSVMKL